MDLWDSPVRVMWDPDGLKLVLVPYGAPMWSPVRVDGGQQVQTSGAIRRAGVKNQPRQNEAHTIEFSIARITDSVEAAIIAGFSDALALPRTMKDVLLSFSSGPQFRVRNCAIERWPHEHDPQHDHVARESVVIRGGELEADGAVYAEGDVWGEMIEGALGTEGGDYLETEGGEYLVGEG